MRCETCGQETEADWSMIFGLEGHGKLCEPCAREYRDGRRAKEVKKKEEQEVLGEAPKPGAAVVWKAPRDLTKVKVAPGEVKPDFKQGSLRMQGYLLALQGTAELPPALVPIVRWLLQNKYLKVVETSKSQVIKEEKAVEAVVVPDAPV